MPAQHLGVRSVWIDRQGAALRPDDDGRDAGWGWRFETLGDMVRAVKEEFDNSVDKGGGNIAPAVDVLP